ncbi:MAG: YafY family transcriptional regulator [Chitinophagaceae bacterium]|nr:MAG: YafY family transcriptional regulator [Chitinophagaceae bacterium]
MNRIDRVSAILTQLQSKRLVKAQEIADRFNISLRTVYRDIKALDEAGVPVIGEAGLGYSLMEGYRLPPVMFTREEAAALITAGKIIDKLTDKATRKSYEEALLKIKAVLRHAEKDFVDGIDEHIAVVKSPYLPDRSGENIHLQAILQNISTKTVLDIGYFANHSQEYSNRLVEPVGIFYASGNWYLVAFCQLRKDYRHFRTDRISYINPTNIHFRQQHPTLTSFIERMKEERAMEKVVIRVEKAVIKYFGEQKYYNGYVSETLIGDKIEMTFLTASLSGFARYFMLFGDHADIVEPETLKPIVEELIAGIKTRLASKDK